MGNEIVRYESLDDLQRLAKLLAASNYFDAKGSDGMAIAQIATKILAGRELGYGPFASVQGIHVIQGRPALSANIMAAAVKNSPRYDYRVRKMDASECAIEFFERCDGKRESLGVSTFTLADAKQAQVKNLDKFARNMLFARAMSNGVRWYCPDVFSGNTVYTPDELGADVDDSGVVVVDASTGEIIEQPQHRPTPVTNGASANGHKPPQRQPAEKAPTNEELDAVPVASDATGQYVTGNDAPIDNPFVDGPKFDAIIATFLGLPKNAWDWAASGGHTENVHSAQNRWTQIVKEKFGSYTPAKFDAIATAYVQHYLSKTKEVA